ncbi:MAG: TonB-dependent receptor domain-containing protein [Acidobacteriota bacterium]
MPRSLAGALMMAGLYCACAMGALRCPPSIRPDLNAAAPANPKVVTLTVVDQNGVAVSGASVQVEAAGQPPLRLVTDYAGRCTWPPRSTEPYTILIRRGGYYETTEKDVDPAERDLDLVLNQEEVLQQEVSVHASTPGIDPEQISDKATINVPEVVNTPFPTYSDIRNLLPYTPSVVADFSGQIHVAGGETWMTLDTLDGFDIRNPVYGTLDMRISTDAVRSIDSETTRYPVEYGRATGGVVAFTSGTGDNKFRCGATNFTPSWSDVSGIGLRFRSFEPLITCAGPIRRNRVWFFDGIDPDYENAYILGLPANADMAPTRRASNLLKFQFNLGSRNSLTAALLWNVYHALYEGLSAVNPEQSTDNHDILAWLPYLQDQHRFRNGVMLVTGFGDMRYREGFEPHGTLPFDLTPELPSGSNFANTTTRSQRFEGYANTWFPARHWLGSHQFRAGFDLDHIRFTGNADYAPVNYLREDRTLERQSTFPAFAPFTGNNLEWGTYVEDRWSPHSRLLLDSGLRFDWDEIIRKPLWSPRFALNYSPPGAGETTFSAGIGVYYEHTQLEYLTRALAGIRYDTYYASDGKTPEGPALETTFTANEDALKEPYAVNWSLGVQHKLPAQIYLSASYLQKITSNLFVYTNQNGSGALSGHYVLTNDRQDHYHSIQIEAHRTFHNSYTLFGAYTHSSATTNSALDYTPTIPLLGPQQSGPVFFDVPNRVLSWGWLPAWVPFFPSIRKNWDFAYSLDWHTGLPYDSINANEQIVGRAGSSRFPNYLSFDPALEWRFHVRGKYFGPLRGKYIGIRGIALNMTDNANDYVVFNNVDSPQYGTFGQPLGRAFTARIRLIQASH